jgi:hypothetical protein
MPDGQPLLSPEDLIPDFPVEEAKRGKKVSLYRWQDADGNWVYSDQPSSSGGDEIVHFDGDINLMKATKSARVKTDTGLSIMLGDLQTAVNAPMQFQEKIDKQHKQLEAVKKQLNH